MFTENEKNQLKTKGISIQKVEEQLNCFKSGFPFLEIKSAAQLNNGISAIDQIEKKRLLAIWQEYLNGDATILKFVPASGAASRMFKDLFEFIDTSSDNPETSIEKKFFNHIQEFAFYSDLNSVCIKNTGKDIGQLIHDGEYKVIVRNLLLPEGLNYGNLPKGLLKFHSYINESRTPTQEHLVEGAQYAQNKHKQVNLHFTVSSEHKCLFEKHINNTISHYEANQNVSFNISFSEQKPSTDTIAADENNDPFIENHTLIFRPGGHGALIENLNDLNCDVVFIKNIDNVVPDHLKDKTKIYKQTIAGKLIDTQNKIFACLKKLEDDTVDSSVLNEISSFCNDVLYNFNNDISTYSTSELKNYLFRKLNRPIRVCGMVKNEGEAGGGPFLTKNIDGTTSLQILESSQINMNNQSDKEALMNSTHFNPVDIVCAIKNYKGEKFDLTKYVDPNTGFISLKSKNGKELKALELPGLWNGAMSDWNTIFVEVPISTFNPVKTVTDLLRSEHQ